MANEWPDDETYEYFLDQMNRNSQGPNEDVIEKPKEMVESDETPPFKHPIITKGMFFSQS